MSEKKIIITHRFDILIFSFALFLELRSTLQVEPPDPLEVAKARDVRLKEMKMHSILKEIIFYFLFITLIVLVANQNRDTRSFNVKDAIMKMLTVENNFTKVSGYFYKPCSCIVCVIYRKCTVAFINVGILFVDISNSLNFHILNMGKSFNHDVFF